MTLKVAQIQDRVSGKTITTRDLVYATGRMGVVIDMVGSSNTYTFNISSTVDNAVGRWTANLTNAMLQRDKFKIQEGGGSSGAQARIGYTDTGFDAITVSTVGTAMTNSGGTLTDQQANLTTWGPMA